MADEDEDESKEDGWIDCYFGYGEGFEGCHCVFEEVWAAGMGSGERSKDVYIVYRCALELQL